MNEFINIKMPVAIIDEDQKIGSAFNHLVQIIYKTEESEADVINWDFEVTEFLTPFFILPLMLYKQNSSKKINLINLNYKIQSYFDAIYFFTGGLNPEKIDNFENFFEKFESKRYIPIVNFPVQVVHEAFKSKTLSVIGKIFKEQLQIEGQLFSGINYLLSESVDNITEHSNCERGYLFAQYYPAKKYIDICIADNGITILGSYKNYGYKKLNIFDDLNAIKSACSGLSTKNLPDAENRGYGITTSKKMLAEGLNGIYFLFSGSAFALREKNYNEKYVKLPDSIRWNGTIVALRVPYYENKEFNIINYIE